MSIGSKVTLSPAEKTILLLVVDGHKNTEIADILGLSRSHVGNTLDRAKRRCGLRTVRQLVYEVGRRKIL